MPGTCTGAELLSVLESSSRKQTGRAGEREFLNAETPLPVEGMVALQVRYYVSNSLLCTAAGQEGTPAEGVALEV